jgi:hypothetical protein
MTATRRPLKTITAKKGLHKVASTNAGGVDSASGNVPQLCDYPLLADYLLQVHNLSLPEQELIVNQAIKLLQEVYVHLPLKKSLLAIDPVQRLRLLAAQLSGRRQPLNDLSFNYEVMSTFISLRDLHTCYIPPQDFNSAVAFLPFYIEQAFRRGDSQPIYIVSKVSSLLNYPLFNVGVELADWNGTPIGRAVEANAFLSAGSNPAARHARGLEGMTIRPLGLGLAPSESWVTVGFLVQAERHEIRIPWRVLPVSEIATAGSKLFGDASGSHSIGIDFATDLVRRTKVALFVPHISKSAAAKVSDRTYGRDETNSSNQLSATSTMPDILSFRLVATTKGSYGYLRIFSFAPPFGALDSTEFVSLFIGEICRILRLLPQNGLIVDIRGNAGGAIAAGESILQLLTPNAITTEQFAFLSSPLIAALTEKYSDLAPWKTSVAQAVETGSMYSQGLPLTSSEDSNTVGQSYWGPVVLITDALMYSTSDIFTAGFRDHAIGTILGVGALLSKTLGRVWYGC